MKVRVIATLVLALGLAFGTANASSIGVFFAPDGSDCDTAIGGFVPATWYILAILGGDAGAGGITGAELRQDGTPAGWFMTANGNPSAAVAVGNPIAPINPGGNIAWAGCQTGTSVLLYTVSGFAATAPVGETYLRIDRHSTPSNPQFPCALLVLCDAPVFTKICVPGGEAIINGRPCTVGVEQKSWSSVKSLYNN